jgi:hypothetical protein
MSRLSIKTRKSKARVPIRRYDGIINESYLRVGGEELSKRRDQNVSKLSSFSTNHGGAPV